MQSAAALWSALQSRCALFGPPTSPATLLIDYLLNVGGFLFATTVYAARPGWLNAALLAPAVVLLVFGSGSGGREGLRMRRRPARGKLVAGFAEAKKKEKEDGKNGQDKHAVTATQEHERPLPIRPIITTYRGAMLVSTALAILAVDFPAFPRRFAKVETWGTSLMDLGVGSFVFSGGVVSARAVLKGGAGQDKIKVNGRLLSRLTASIRHALPLVGLGFARLASVKGVDYAEHVSEYGVHWNFFFTLALLAPVVELVHSAVDAVVALLPSLPFLPGLLSTSGPVTLSLAYDALAVVAATAYQVALESTGLTRFILLAPRAGPAVLGHAVPGPAGCALRWLAANREGVCSLTGYAAIFFAGRATGLRTLAAVAGEIPEAVDAEGEKTGPGSQGRRRPRPRSQHRHRLSPATRLLTRLFVATAAYAALLLAQSAHLRSHGGGMPVSRRLANLPYVLWVAAFNNGQLLLFCGVDALFFGGAAEGGKGAAAAADSGSGSLLTHNTDTVATTNTSPILRAFNANGLALFLAANLLTGAVNLGVDTLAVGTWGAVGILVVYSGTLAAVAVWLDWKGLRLRV